MLSPADVQMISPALANYTQGVLFGDLWKRPDLSARDRGIVTVAVLIARNQSSAMPYYFNLALDHGTKPAELSEIITHLAFYCGWPNAMSAVEACKAIFTDRGIRADQLPAASPKLLPLDQSAERKRAARVEQDVGPVSRGLVNYTAELLFLDL